VYVSNISVFYISRHPSTTSTVATTPQYESCWHYSTSTVVVGAQCRARSQKRRKGRSLVDTNVLIDGWGDRSKDQALVFFGINT